MGRIDQTQPIAQSNVTYHQRYMGTSQVTWGPTTTATILQTLASFAGLRWVGMDHQTTEYVVYVGPPKAPNHLAEVKFQGSSQHYSAGWLHISSDDENILTMLWKVVTEAIEWPTVGKALAANVDAPDL